MHAENERWIEIGRCEYQSQQEERETDKEKKEWIKEWASQRANINIRKKEEKVHHHFLSVTQSVVSVKKQRSFECVTVWYYDFVALKIKHSHEGKCAAKKKKTGKSEVPACLPACLCEKSPSAQLSFALFFSIQSVHAYRYTSDLVDTHTHTHAAAVCLQLPYEVKQLAAVAETVAQQQRQL